MRLGEFLVALALMTISLVSPKANSREIDSDPLNDGTRPTPEVVNNVADETGRTNEEQVEINEVESPGPPPLVSKDKAQLGIL